MNKKVGLMIRLLGAAYMVYLGASLLFDALREKPEQYILFLIFGIIFIAFGAGLGVWGLKDLKKED